MTLPAGYSLETVDIPDTELEVGGLNVQSDDTLLTCTRQGELWELDPSSGEWTLKTESLHQTLGIWTEDDSEDIWVMQKPELTRLVDETDDPLIDRYDTVCDDFGISGDYHEFAFGPVRDSEGNFHLNLNLGAEGGYGPCTGVMQYSAPYRGYHVKVTPDGEFIPYANGLRSPTGIGINGDDEVFYTDNQGDWVPVCHVAHVTEGSFHGHPHSLAGDPDFPDLQGLCQSDADAETYLEERKPPVAWIPYNVQTSSGGITFDKEGNFGPFQGQAFFGDQENGNILRIAMEEVNGSYQGFAVPFTDVADLQCGTIREEFTNDGSTMYLGQTNRGWGSVGNEPYGVQRISYDGETTPFAIHSVEIMESGFRVNFTKPAAGEAGTPDSYDLSRWTYNYFSSYGSGRVNETGVDATGASVVDGGSAVELDLPSVGPADVSGTRTVQGRVYQITANVSADDGSELAHNTGWYTVNDTPN